jgi:hypothetical protein
LGKSFCIAPTIQLPSIVIDVLALPSASPPQPAPTAAGVPK